MIMITPNEFLQFAKEMGLENIESTSTSQSISNNNGYTTTGLSALNNLCRLIEQIHQLKAENDHLRAHIELIDHVDKFQQRFSLTDNHENKNENHKQIISSTATHNEEKSNILSPSNSLKIKRSTSNRERKSINYGNNEEDSSSVLQIDRDQIEPNDNLPSAQTASNWSKVRHAFKFSLRRKQSSPHSPPSSFIERQIPTISISVESDEDHLLENKSLKKKKIITTNDNQPMIAGEDTDQDDESIQFIRTYHKRRLHANERSNSTSIDRQETQSVNLSSNTSNIDDEPLLTRKQSKIARYRRKLRSKLNTVKRQFSEQSPSSSARCFHNPHALTFDDIGSGVNHALITAQLAPALTKAYQQKMHEWESMQKSHFLVNYRRQSIIPKIDLKSNSRKSSLASTTKETSTDPTIPSSTIDNCSSLVDELNLELETNLTGLSPILSPHQRSLIVHQWREIMSEEISLRHYNEYLQKQMILLKELETNLKTLKTNIFCTNYSIKQQSMINIRQNNQYKQSYIPQRSRSLQSLISMPASWILAVQSAAYSDILDGTSKKTTERAILFNKNFFDQFEHFKRDRQKFEQNSIKHLQLLSHLKKNERTISNENRSNQSRVKFIKTRGRLRKLSLISISEFPQHIVPDPVIPLQITISQLKRSSKIECLPTTITNEIDSNKKLSLSSNNSDKRPKHSLFDLRRTFQRSRSMCVTQFHSWLQRRRQRHSSEQGRQSSMESKIITPYSTPTFLGSPRLGRLRKRILKYQTLPSPKTDHTPLPIFDDSDNGSQYELPVRIYFPPSTTSTGSHHVRTTDIKIITSNNDNQDIQIEQTSDLATPPILNRQYSSSSTSSSLKMTTAKERRESFATVSNFFTNSFL